MTMGLSVQEAEETDATIANGGEASRASNLTIIITISADDMDIVASIDSGHSTLVYSPV